MLSTIAVIAIRKISTKEKAIPKITYNKIKESILGPCLHGSRQTLARFHLAFTRERRTQLHEFLNGQVCKFGKRRSQMFAGAGWRDGMKNRCDNGKFLVNKPRNKSGNFPRNANSNVILFLSNHAILNTERSYKRQGHATLKHFVGFFVQWWKAEITVA